MVTDEQLDEIADIAYGEYYPHANPKLTGKQKAWKGDPSTNPLRHPIKLALEKVLESTTN